VEGGGPAIFPFDSRNCMYWQIESKIRGFPTQAHAWFGFTFVISTGRIILWLPIKDRDTIHSTLLLI
jgi:hypothetical protein